MMSFTLPEELQMLRDNLRRAQGLLQQAGWTYRDGALRNAKGDPLVLEYLDSSEGKLSTFASWARNLEKLGITLKFRSVDFALYLQRLQKFDFDLVTLAVPGTNTPGKDYADLFGSKAADTEDSGNMAGVKSPAVDALINAMVGAKTRSAMLAACRSLDRVIAHGHYLIPQYTSVKHRVAYNAWHLVEPATMPPYAQAEGWAIDTWWARLPPKTQP